MEVGNSEGIKLLQLSSARDVALRKVLMRKLGEG
jgi:hypothetical protein